MKKWIQKDKELLDLETLIIFSVTNLRYFSKLKKINVDNICCPFRFCLYDHTNFAVILNAHLCRHSGFHVIIISSGLIVLYIVNTKILSQNKGWYIDFGYCSPDLFKEEVPSIIIHLSKKVILWNHWINFMHS